MEPVTFVLFGATGDLAKRKIYPALYNLYIEQKLPPYFHVFGLGRREWTDDIFKSNVEQSIADFSRRKVKDPVLLKSFLNMFQYQTLDIGRKEDYEQLLERIEKRENGLSLTPNRMFYLSVGPEFFAPIAANIKGSGLGSAAGWKRLLIEKPFGHDLASARELNRQLSEAFEEQEIFRIDHYLGKPTVQKLVDLQQQHPELQALWTEREIANVQVTANETVGVEDRAGYYDHSGAVRDMFQNHMLQLLMMLAILPKNVGPEEVPLMKRTLMSALVPLNEQEISARVIRGQYTAGSIQGKPVQGYTAEPNISADSLNDTFIAAKLMLEDDYWSGIPLYIRTGKRLKEKSTRIVVEFKDTSEQDDTAASEPKPRLLVIEMSPQEGITLQFNPEEALHDNKLQPIRLDVHGADQELPEAYENLLHDALLGKPTFFAHWDEVELAWQWVEPVLQAFKNNHVPLQLYAAGSYGPDEADALVAKDGFHWWFDSKENAHAEAPVLHTSR